MNLALLQRFLRPFARMAISVATTAVLSACATQHAGTAATPPASSAAARPLTEAPYRLGSGDELTIKFFYTPELNEEQIIRPDGMISMPLIGEVRATGLSPGQLHDKLVTAYSTKYLKSGSTEIQVTVRASNSARVFVGGEVGRAGAVPLIGRMTLSRAILAAQGFTATAYTGQVLLIHAADDGQVEVHQVNVANALKLGAEDPLVSSEDIVFVPRSPISRVDLFVEQYIMKALPFSMGVTYNFTNGVRVY
jgi:protein involved in polysaccharide export with SLBB domain